MKKIEKKKEKKIWRLGDLQIQEISFNLNKVNKWLIIILILFLSSIITINIVVYFFVFSIKDIYTMLILTIVIGLGILILFTLLYLLEKREHKKEKK